MKLTHLFKRDPAAAEQLVAAAKSNAPSAPAPIPYEKLLEATKSTAAPPPPPAAQPGAFTWAAAQQIDEKMHERYHSRSKTGPLRLLAEHLGPRECAERLDARLLVCFGVGDGNLLLATV